MKISFGHLYVLLAVSFDMQKLSFSFNTHNSLFLTLIYQEKDINLNYIIIML